MNESKTIQEIVENVAKQLPKELHLEKDLFGIDSAVEEIYQKIRMELNHVRAIGIRGMGGIGKTTTAKAFYNKYSNKFNRSCFIDKVKQYSRGGSCDLLPLLNQALTGLLGKDYKVTNVASGFRQLKHRLSSNKALIVLDDLDEASYSEFLKGLCNSFSAGSRIIVTTRDVHLLNQLKNDIKEVDIHMAKELGNDDSLKLFCYHAFGTHTPPENLAEHSKSLVSYAGGLPLALKVLGSSLHGRSHVSFWLKKLEEVKQIPAKKILEILLLSYHDLSSDTEKTFFLDIACFFVGKHKVDAVEIFKSSTSYPEVEITILVERCLLEIDEKGMFHMHDLLQDMGRELGKSTRLIWRGNALSELQKHKGKEKIEVLILDVTVSKEKLISSEIFEMLPKLRLLEIVCAHSIEGDFANSFHDLECIYWSYCSWTQLPSSFHPQKLICLSMPYSNFKRLWNNTPAFKDLKSIDLTLSLELETTPDFGNSKSVKRLSFFGCGSLLEVHPSITDLTDLHHLDIRGCTQLKKLSHLKRSPEPIKHWAIKGFLAPKQLGDMKELKELSHLKRSPEPIKLWASMVFLGLSHCSNLARLPKQLGDMKGLQLIDASHTAIEQLPDSITHLKRLLTLVLSNCNKLSKLPEDIGNMEALMVFNACYSAIEQLPDSFAGLIKLVELDLTGCKNLRNLPNSIRKLELLQVLYLNHCSKLEGLPDELGNMQCLETLYAAFTAIEQIPDSIQQLSRLRKLDVTSCDKLRYVPDSVWNLASLTRLYIIQSGIGCRNNLPNTVKNTKLATLGLSCDIRSWFPMLQSFSSLEELYLRDEYDGESLSSAEPISLSELYNLQVLELYSCTRFGSLFPELPPNLTYLSICGNGTLGQLPGLSGFKQLKRLDILSYQRLESLPPLPPSLQSLTVSYCTSLQVPSDMSMLKELVDFSFGRCNHELNGFQPIYLEFAEWFSYKSSGKTLCCDIPPLLGDNFLGLAIWVLFNTNIKECNYIKVVLTNKTNGITECYWIPLIPVGGAEIYSVAKCISRDQISITSGDRIEISFERQLYGSVGENKFPSYEVVQVVMCAAHVIQKTPFTPDFPSFFNNLINGDKWKINKPLSSEKKKKIYDDWGWGLDRMVKIAGGISHRLYQLSEGSMLSLAPNTWIDDRIIYGYMTLLRDREQGIEDEKLWERKPSYYFMDPLFMQLAKRKNYKKLSSFETLHCFFCDWATSSVGPSINTVDHIFVPACVKENHWIVFVFAVKAWTVILLDSQNDDPHYPEEEEVMVGLVPAMLRYWGRNQFSYPNEDASFYVLERRPTQSNSSDCGIYVMKFMDYILQGFTIGDFTWWPEDIETFRCRIARELQKGKARHIPGFFMLQRLENAST